MIRFQCECGRQLQVGEENAGKKALCPSCGREQVVPDPETAVQREVDVPPLEPTERRVRRGRSERRGEERDYEDRRRRSEEPVPSGLAITSLVLGLLSLFCTYLTGLPAIVLGLLALRDVSNSQGRKTGKGLAISGMVTGLVLGTISLVGGILIYLAIEEVGGRRQTQNNLKQIGLAMLNYHDTFGHFPPAGDSEPRGQANVSWRVAILPFVEHDSLWRQFHLNEPWDSPTNQPLLAKMPKLYLLPGQKADGSGLTHYQGVMGPGSIFESPLGCRIAEIVDGTSNTILIVEAATPVPWTRPADMAYNPKAPLALPRHWRGGFHALFADGSVRWIPATVPPQTFEALVTRNGGEVVNLP
jgi:hypothetical protein